MGGTEDPGKTAEAEQTIEVEKVGAPLPESLPSPPKSKSYTYDPTEDREKARGLIAQALVGILALIVLFAFLTMWLGSVKSEDLKDLLSVLMGPVAALAGSATGFYFGGKVAADGNKPAE